MVVVAAVGSFRQSFAPLAFLPPLVAGFHGGTSVFQEWGVLFAASSSQLLTLCHSSFVSGG